MNVFTPRKYTTRPHYNHRVRKWSLLLETAGEQLCGYQAHVEGSKLRITKDTVSAARCVLSSALKSDKYSHRNISQICTLREREERKRHTPEYCNTSAYDTRTHYAKPKHNVFNQEIDMERDTHNKHYKTSWKWNEKLYKKHWKWNHATHRQPSTQGMRNTHENTRADTKSGTHLSYIPSECIDVDAIDDEQAFCTPQHTQTLSKSPLDVVDVDALASATDLHESRLCSQTYGPAVIDVDASVDNGINDRVDDNGVIDTVVDNGVIDVDADAGDGL